MSFMLLAIAVSFLCSCDSKSTLDQTDKTTDSIAAEGDTSKIIISEQESEKIARRFMEEYVRLLNEIGKKNGQPVHQQTWQYSVRLLYDNWIVIASPGYPDGYRILEIDPNGDILTVSKYRSSWNPPMDIRGLPIEVARAYLDNN